MLNFMLRELSSDKLETFVEIVIPAAYGTRQLPPERDYQHERGNWE
jgi:hypothetical protein